jgi:hypothetical protein
MNNLIEEVIDLKIKLKESYAINEDLKSEFKKNLSKLQNTVKECMEDRDQLMARK